MKFCNKLFRYINFEPSAIQPCCNTHAIQVPRFMYSGEYIDMYKYTEFILNIFNSLQSNSQICQGCPDLEDKEYSKEQIAKFFTITFDAVSLNMHRFLCNCKCEYCDYWHKQHKGYKILEPLKSLYAQKVINDNTVFSWGGGEPTIQPDFEEASTFIETISPYQYIHTNSIKFSDAIANLLKNNHAQINISLDSSSPETYKKVKGVDKYKQVVNNLIKYRKNSSDTAIHLKYIIYEQNNSIPEIENFLLFAKNSLNIVYVEYSFDFREVNKKAVSKKSIIAASFFEKRAQSLRLDPSAFFIGSEYEKQISEAMP